MLAGNTSIEQLKSAFPRAGRIAWIGLRPARRQPLQIVTEALALAGQGLRGDRYHSRNEGRRQVIPVAPGFLVLGVRHSCPRARHRDES